ncbi:MAG: DUF131 domain-containing protein [Nitrososphaerota archaeon]
MIEQKSNAAYILFVAGIIVLFVGFAIMVLGTLPQTAQSSFAGVIFIGPFPIVFGTGPSYPILIAIGIVIAVVMVLFSYLMYRGARKQYEKLQ